MAEPRKSSDPKSQPTPMQMGIGHGPRGVVPRERSKNMGAVLHRIWGYVGRQRSGLIIVLLCTALSSACTLAGPFLIGKSVDLYIANRDAQGLLQMCLILLAVYVAGTLISWLQQYVMVGVSQHTVRAMRQDLFDQFQKLPLRYFDSKTHGELMSRTTNDISNVSNVLNQSVTQLISSVFMLVGSIVMMLSLSVWLTLVTLVTIPLVTFTTKKITKYTRVYFADQQKSLGEVSSYIEETISGQRVVKVFNREERAIDEFRSINEKLRAVSIKSQSLSGSMGPIMNTVSNLSFAIVAFGGGVFAFYGVVTLGIIVSFLNYSKQFSQPLNQLANQYNLVQSAIAGAERVFEVLDTKSEYEEAMPLNTLEHLRGEVVFDEVSFGYKQGVSVLKNVSLTAKPGDTIALVGPTGAGKTTIVNLLTRFYDIDAGMIRVDGQNLQSLDKDWLRSRLGIVLQDAYLFSDTIRENIRYGRLDATDEEVVRAAKLANADVFIRKMPGGYDSVLTTEGSNLSQGQKQLLTIARAILANPAILILDEATSSVDTRTEVQIQEAMRTLMEGRTSFVIAHRLSTIRDADQILVIDDGEIVERGTHQELLEQRGVYYGLYETSLAWQ